MLQDDVIEYIADKVLEIQAKSTVNYTLQGLKNQYADAEKALGNVMKAIEQGIITDTTKNRLVELEAQVSELKLQIAKEEIKKPVLAREHILFWLHSFRDGDISDPEFREKICDVFINQVVVYNEKVVIIYNFSDANNNHSINFTSVLRGSDEPRIIKILIAVIRASSTAKTSASAAEIADQIGNAEL